MEYAIKVTTVEVRYVQADNYNEALDKARTGDCEYISLVSTHYENVEEGDEDSG